MIANFPVWGKVAGLPKFEYTGTYEAIEDGGGNWRIKFLTSGVFTPIKDITIDAFLVGGGGSGAYGTSGDGAGAGGGYTVTGLSIALKALTNYNIVVGAGGVAPTGTSSWEYNGKQGGSSEAFGLIAEGGKGGLSGQKKSGGKGGSGGGGSDGGDGGSDGSNGLGSHGGSGQGTTTREFGESSGQLYAGGGGGNRTGKGGAGGGANGDTSAEPNTGGGGGGGRTPGAGGSGIVVIRNTRAA